MTRAIAALLVAVAGFLLLGPAAAAQAPAETEIKVTAEDPGQHVPVHETAEVPVTVAGFCTGANPSDHGSAYLGDRTVHLDAESPSPGIDAEVDPATVTLPRRPCEDGEVTADATLAVRPGRTADAFTVERVQVTAKADGDRAETQVPVSPDWFPAMATEAPDEPVTAEAGSTVEVPVSVANVGNGPARIAIEVVEAAPALEFDAPEPFEVAPRGDAGEILQTVTVPVTVDDEAPTDDVLPLELGLATAYAVDTSLKGPTYPVNLGVDVSSASGTIEAALLPAAGAAILAGGALVARVRGAW
jgi:hypothetical protein